jgi:hypothetical protein
MIVVMFGMVLGRLVRRVSGVQPMGMREMGVMAAFFVFAVVVMLRRLAVMMGRLFVVLGGLLVMLLMRLIGTHAFSPMTIGDIATLRQFADVDSTKR